MDRKSFLALLRRHRAIAVIRSTEVKQGLHLARAAEAGGIRLIEITWNSTDADRLVGELIQQLPHCCIGVGTVLAIADLEHAAEAGAQFCFCPHTNQALIQAAQALPIPIVPGALTPSEIVAAWQAGASAVKVFPISAVGGASYIRSLQGPLAHIPLVPTGGVSVENAAAMVEAGAIAVGISTGLFPQPAVSDRSWSAVTALSNRLTASLGAVAVKPYSDAIAAPF
ncbi:bifunctional 4-hydroxy-2-oxoglutarate aldolase/2-dehydro-3-deoxy-phosphogluconate aldolase [Nodosilinea nodulosa]|uniref:bifunctional 4-hydroxy-2-oxoglutarate aldolase/2-dehydro-3-deoxy-phosphogluconate aldolase n=1 Tax=Nodosilinea nodulosa TaxID=416001 RepID=UPI0003047A1A|nr:bifunctional 4-hydroxy-2-oxoglutarate aldolase/2-dehydro-3-deoxy-phosphogluconate aldolase [Nodosilinea nodulosa]